MPVFLGSCNTARSATTPTTAPPSARHGRLGQRRPGRLGPHGSAHHAGAPAGGDDDRLLPRGCSERGMRTGGHQPDAARVPGRQSRHQQHRGAISSAPRAQRRAGAATAGGSCTYTLRLAARDLHNNGHLGVAQAQSARRAQQEGPSAAARGRGGCKDPARPRTHRARHERACRRAGGARSTRPAQAGRRHLRPARRAAPPGGHSARLRAGGREGREGGQARGGKRVCAEGGPEGERRSIMRPSLPNATLWLARERSLVFVFVVHIMHATSGAMQLSRW
eukprot:scaffold23655_cov65-Phaeocystis_antarctica.AAC.9